MDDLKLFAKNKREIYSLMQTLRIYVFSGNLEMQFVVEKGAVLSLRRGKRVDSDGILLLDGLMLKALEENVGYKYLGVLEVDSMIHEEEKERLNKST